MWAAGEEPEGAGLSGRSPTVTHLGGPADDHYAALGEIQPIEVVEAWGLNYHEGNILKYLSRWKRKGGTEDLEKLVWYANRLLKVQKG